MPTKSYLFPKNSHALALQSLVASAVQSLYAIDLPLTSIHFEHPANNEHGDWSTNLAMALAKQVGKPPKEIASELVASIIDTTLIERMEIAGPGFINFYLHNSLFKQLLLQIDADFGRADIGSGKTIMVEFGQPNTHKAFHVGHLKSAISGLSVVKLYENLGYKVIKANFYGDIGMHVAKSTWGMLQKGVPADFDSWDVHARMKYIDAAYAFGAQRFSEDKEAEAAIRKINSAIYREEDSVEVAMYETIRGWSLQHLQAAFASLGISYDRQYPESEIYKDAIKLVQEHVGDVFVESDGAIIYDGKAEGLTTWVFLTQEGNPTYSAKDLALAYKKFAEYDIEFAIVTTSVEQKDYFRAVISCLEKIRPDLKGRYKHVPFGWLLRNNKKTSSRMGDSIKGMDILQEAIDLAATKIQSGKDYSEDIKQSIAAKVGIAGLRFLILSHEFHKDINYDPDQFISLEGFSGPYIMYAYSRARSILRQAELASEFNNKLDSRVEQELLRLLARYPEVAMQAAEQTAPHLVCVYLYDLAQKFNQFYKESPVLNATDENLKQSRLRLTSAAAQVLAAGLALLGIEVVENM